MTFYVLRHELTYVCRLPDVPGQRHLMAKAIMLKDWDMQQKGYLKAKYITTTINDCMFVLVCGNRGNAQANT